MPLSMVEEGEPKTIVKVGGKEEVRKFLENLGFVDGTVVTVVSSLGGNMILKVKSRGDRKGNKDRRRRPYQEKNHGYGNHKGR